MSEVPLYLSDTQNLYTQDPYEEILADAASNSGRENSLDVLRASVSDLVDVLVFMVGSDLSAEGLQGDYLTRAMVESRGMYIENALTLTRGHLRKSDIEFYLPILSEVANKLGRRRFTADYIKFFRPNVYTRIGKPIGGRLGRGQQTETFDSWSSRQMGRQSTLQSAGLNEVFEQDFSGRSLALPKTREDKPVEATRWATMKAIEVSKVHRPRRDPK